MHPNGKGSTKKWDVAVVSLIMQLLIGGTKPTAIHIILQAINSQYRGNDLDKILCVSFIQQCRIYCFIVNDILAAIRLGRAASWGAFYHNGTSQRQLSLYLINCN